MLTQDVWRSWGFLIVKGGGVSLCDIVTCILSYSFWLISSTCLTMVASIHFVGLTCRVFPDEVGGLDRIGWQPGPFFPMLFKVCEGCCKRDHYWWCSVPLVLKLAWYCLHWTTCHWMLKKFMALTEVEHVFNCMGTLVTVEFWTISFQDRLSDDSTRIFRSAPTSSNALWVVNCSLITWA